MAASVFGSGGNLQAKGDGGGRSIRSSAMDRSLQEGRHHCRKPGDARWRASGQGGDALRLGRPMERRCDALREATAAEEPILVGVLEDSFEFMEEMPARLQACNIYRGGLQVSDTMEQSLVLWLEHGLISA